MGIEIQMGLKYLGVSLGVASALVSFALVMAALIVKGEK